MSIYPSSHGWDTGSQDWEIVPTDWWRTHYSTVSWVYIQDPAQDKKFQHRQYQGSLFPGPLLVHVAGRSRPPSRKGDARGHGETGLNVDLVGVKGALEAVVAYETSVGFHYQAFPKIEPEELEYLIALSLSTRVVNVEDTRVHQIRWNEFLEDLMNSPLPDSPSDSDEASDLGASTSSVGDSLLQSTSTLSSVDLTSSEGSLESQPMPSTPQAKFSLHHPIEVKDRSPTGSIRISPIRSLSALASSFIPTSSSHTNSIDDPIQFPLLHETSRSSSKLSSFADFIFPSLNPPMSTSSSSTPIKLRKDSEGFFTDECSNSTPTPLLPPFLQESSQRNVRMRKSRTRELVDRLRSESVPNEERAPTLPKARHAVSPKYASYCPSPQLLDDFALSLIKPRRSLSEDGSGEQRPHRQTASTTSFSASASASASTSRLSTPDMEDDDGWIDIADLSHSRSSPGDKPKRTRELFLALTRRRTDSASPEMLRDIMDQATAQASEGVTEDISISSAPSPPSPPLRADIIIRSVSTSPPVTRTGTVTSTDGWVETSPIVHENPPKVQQKEKTPKKDTHFRKKSQNNNSGPPLWARGSAFQPTPPSMPHPLRPPNLPLSPFPPLSTSTAFPHPVLPPHVMPPSTIAATGPGAMPYFFPSYPNPNLPMSVRLPPIPPVNYPTVAYRMNIPNAYPMPPPPPPVPLQSYMAGPPLFSGVAPGGYVHTSRTTSMPSAGKIKMPSFTTAHPNMAANLPMSVPGGAGYSALNGSKVKW